MSTDSERLLENLDDANTKLFLLGADKTIRIWANQTRIEVARLSHNERVVNVFWTEGDTGIISLGDDGMISKWTRTVRSLQICFSF